MTLARDLANLARTTTTTAELNKLDGFTGVAADLNYAKDLKATGVTTTEFDHLDGVANSLAVTDITSQFTRSSNFSGYNNNDRVYLSNGFVFYNLSAVKTGSPSSGSIIWTIASGYRPNQTYSTNSITFQGDHVNQIYIKTNGDITVDSPYVFSSTDSAFRIVINGWYKT